MIPLVFLTGLAFAGMGLIMTALSPSYDFFMYYFTLAITPMMLALRRVLPARAAARAGAGGRASCCRSPTPSRSRARS